MYYNPLVTNVLRAILVLGAVTALYFKLFDPDNFDLRFAREDGVVEYSTAILLFCSALALIGLGRRNTGYYRWLLFFYAVAFFFAAGEEVSWGQRIIGWESGEFWQANNYQNETTLHNLVVGDVHLAEEVFGNALSLILLSYLVVLPLVYPIAGWARRFCEILAVPVPPRYIAAVAIAWTVFIVWIDLPRNWEVYEFAFSVMACLIFLNPHNRELVGPKN